MTKTKQPTPFELAKAAVANGTLSTPSVSSGGKNINYFGYQLATHHFNLKIMASGMTCRGIKLKDLKAYYGLTGKSAKECLTQYEVIFNEYKQQFKEEKISASSGLN